MVELCYVTIIIIILLSVPNGTHDGRINCKHVCVRVGERNEKEKKSLLIKIKFRKSSKWLTMRQCSVCGGGVVVKGGGGKLRRPNGMGG